MPVITSLMLRNFKKFDSLTLNFQPGRNVLIGDNESGKSSILLALDLVLSNSRHRVEALGLESLLSQHAVTAFQAGERRAELLPELIADVFFSPGRDPDLNGRQNLADRDADGLRMCIAPMLDEYGQDIRYALDQDTQNFPYEYYAVKFSTFSGGPCAGYRRYLRHMLLDSARIDSDHAAQEYTRAVFGVSVSLADRYRLENTWRQQKNHFREQHLASINGELDTYQFSVRYGGKAGLEANLDITEEGISIRSRGKGRQCFIKTEFALRRREKRGELHALLLEEPENHLSHVNMKKLVSQLAAERQTQLFVATHSSHISSRLDLRNAILLGDNRPVMLEHLSVETAHFFMKAPDNNVLEFALSQKVILVEGDAEFILIEAFYRSLIGRVPEDDNVHVIAIGGTSFRRYSLDEREEISRELVAKLSIRDIAAKLSRAPSTISREVRRHGGAKEYRAAKADAAAWERALRLKPCKLIESPTLCKIIAEKMHQDWSPEQIAGWLKRCYPDNQEMHVSYETIYKTLFIQTRGALKRAAAMPQKRKSRA